MDGLPSLFKYLPSADRPDWPLGPCSDNKPVGWWLSVEDAGPTRPGSEPNGCGGEDPVTLTPDARVAMFASISVEHAAFGDRYCAIPDWAERFGWSHVADPEWDLAGVVPNPDVAVLGPAGRRPIPDAPPSSGGSAATTSGCRHLGSREKAGRLINPTGEHAQRRQGR